jgi:polyferredoxin
MTPREARILGWTCLIFGFAFTFSAPWSIAAQLFALVLLFSAFGLIGWTIWTDYHGGGDGPVKPA